MLLNMRGIFYLFIPAAVLICLLIACKWMNFSIIPEGMKMSKPPKFKFPNLARNGYKWDAWEGSSSEEEDDDSSDEYESSSSSDEESEDEYIF